MSFPNLPTPEIFPRISQLIFSRGEVRRAVFLCDDKFAPSIRPLSISAELTRSGTVCFGASRGGGQSDRYISEGLRASPSPGGPCSRRMKRPESASTDDPRLLCMVSYVCCIVSVEISSVTIHVCVCVSACQRLGVCMLN